MKQKGLIGIGLMREVLSANKKSIADDTRILWRLNRFAENHGTPWSDAAKDRKVFHCSIKAATEDGMIAVVWSGMDCDCVRWSNRVYLVEADWRKVDAHIEEECYSAEGTVSYQIMKPSEANKLKRQSRDLILEAFEDGHAHYVIDPGYC